MITGHPRKPAILSEEVRGAIVNYRSSPQGLVRRAQIDLLAADGISNNAIASRRMSPININQCIKSNAKENPSRNSVF